MNSLALNSFDKSDLVRVARHIGAFRGDDARTKKSAFVEILADQNNETVATAFRELEIMVREAIEATPNYIDYSSDTDQRDGQKIAKIEPETVPVETTQSTDPAAMLKQAIEQIAGSQSQPVDANTVNALIDEKLQAAVTDVAALFEAKIEQRPPRLIVEKATGQQIEIPSERHVNYETLIVNYHARVNTMMVGPSGSGKSHIVEQMANDLGVKYGSQSCSIGMSESAFTGYLIPTGDNGKFEYVSSVFVEIYENGGIFLIDEIDASDPNLLVFFNMALGNGGFFLPQRSEKPYVKRHPDCWIVAAANTYGDGASAMYAGREQQDAALLERFRAGMVEFDYDKKLEAQLYPADLVGWAHETRQQIADNRFRQLVSMHFLKSATRLLEQGRELEEIKASYFLNWSEDERRTVVR